MTYILNFIRLAILTALLSITAYGVAEALPQIRVATAIDDIDQWEEWIAQGDCSGLPDLGRNLRRNELELVLLCRSLRMFEPQLGLILVPSANYSRNLRLVLDGKVDIASETVWFDDVAEMDLHISEAVLQRGKMVKGVYTRKDHPLRAMALEDVDLSQYHGVTMSNWAYDWQLLGSLTAHTSSALNTYSAYKIINSQRADFTLAEFPAGDEMVVICEGEHVYPIHGIKVAMPWSRHFIVSKSSENGALVSQLLNRGLAQLHQQGQVDIAYQSIGFYNQNTANWQLVGATSTGDASLLSKREAAH